MSKQQLLDSLDVELENGTIHPLTLVLDILENHILRDGVRGQDKFQDLVLNAWVLLCKSHEFSSLN